MHNQLGRGLGNEQHRKKSISKNANSFNSESLLSLCDNLQDIVFRVNSIPYHHFEYVNGAIETLTGYSPQEFDRNPGLLKKIFYPDDLPKIDLLSEKPDTDIENVLVRLFRKNGQVIWVEILLAFVRDDQGKAFAAEGVMRDATAKVLARQEIEVERDLVLELSSTIDLIEAIEKIITAIISLPGVECGSGYFYNQSHNKLNVVKSINVSEEYEEQVLSFGPDSKYYQVMAAQQPVFLKANEVPSERLKALVIQEGFLCLCCLPVIYHDQMIGVMNFASKTQDEFSENVRALMCRTVTLVGGVISRMRAEEALKESEERFRSLVDEMPEIVFELDYDDKISFMNKAGELAFGYTQKEFLTNMHATDVVVPPDHPMIYKNLKKIHGGATATWNEYIGKRKDGSTFPIMTRSNRIMKNGERIGIRGLIIDMTKIRAMESQIQTKAREAELYNDILTHDINNINQTTLTYINLLLSEEFGQVNPDQRGFLETCRRQVNRCTNLTRNIRTLSQIKNSADHPLVKIDLGGVIDRTVRNLLAAINIPDFDVDSDDFSGRKVLGDNLIHLLFFNLIENAYKHNSEKSHGQIRVVSGEECNGNGDFWTISVEDNGQGVKDDFKPMVFNRFESSKRHKGSGLGLTIVKTLADKYKGFVRLEDRVAGDYTKGCRFVVALPKA